MKTTSLLGAAIVSLAMISTSAYAGDPTSGKMYRDIRDVKAKHAHVHKHLHQHCKGMYTNVHAGSPEHKKWGFDLLRDRK
jgi:hypothetical protein